MVSEIVFRANNLNVVGEVLDGEAIIVDLDSGAYYSLVGSGAEVWSAVQKGATLTAIIESVTAVYSGRQEEIAAAVTALVEELLAEGLIVGDSSTAGSSVAAIANPAPPAAGRPPFVKPVVQKFTDMADLLLLDPIHDVDVQGWPHAAPPK